MSQPVAERRISRVFSAPDLATPGVALNAAEIHFFKDHGFLVKHALLHDDAMAAVVERVWEHLLEVVPRAPQGAWRLDRNDPRSWLNPRWAPMPPHPQSGPHEGRAPVEYYDGIVKLHTLGQADFLLRDFADHPRVREVASALLGPPLRSTRFFRGVYAIFPTRDGTSAQAELERRRPTPHTDQVCQQLNACAYLGDVGPRAGGFTAYHVVVAVFLPRRLAGLSTPPAIAVNLEGTLRLWPSPEDRSEEEPPLRARLVIRKSSLRLPRQEAISPVILPRRRDVTRPGVASRCDFRFACERC